MNPTDVFAARAGRVDALVDAFELFVTSSGASCSRQDARGALESIVSAHERASWHEHVARAAQMFGVTTKTVEIGRQELRDVVRGRAPLLGVDEDGGALVILGVDGATVEVSDRRARGRSRKIPVSALGSLFGIRDDAGAPVTLVAGQSSTTLDAMRTPPNGSSPARRLRALLVLERDDLWVAVVYAVAVGLLSLATPLAVQTLVNTVAFGALAQPLVVLTLLVFAGLAFAGFLRGLQAWVVERVQQRIFARVAMDLAHRLPRMTLDARRQRHGPELLNRFFDVVTIQKGAAALLVDGIAIILQTVLGMVLLGLYHPMLLGFAVILALSILGVVFGAGRGATPTAVEESKAKYAVAAWLQEVARHEVVFGSPHGAALAVQRAEALTRVWITKRRKHFGIVFRQIAGALVLQAVASAVLLGVGGALVLARQLTLGQLVAAELIVSAVVAGFSKMGKYLESYYDLVAAIDKVGEVVDVPLERADGVELVSTARPFAVRVVEEGRASFAVRAGDASAVVVRDERARARLGDLVAMRTVPSDGCVEIEGHDTRLLAPVLARRDVALVREPEIFAGTVAENVAAGRPTAFGELREALETAGAWDAVLAMRDGMRTALVTADASLARELALRITLARALVGRPRLLVLDGALDAMPSAARDELVARLRACAWTTLVVLTADEPFARASLETVYVEPSS